MLAHGVDPKRTTIRETVAWLNVRDELNQQEDDV